MIDPVRDNIIIQNQIAIAGQALHSVRQHKTIMDQMDKNSQLQGDIHNKQNEIAELKNDKERNDFEQARLARENRKYKEALSRPILEVLNENDSLKEAYERQQEILKEWIISQNAWKALAYKFAKDLKVENAAIIKESQNFEEKARDIFNSPNRSKLF